jgi:hypothetical protein
MGFMFGWLIVAVAHQAHGVRCIEKRGSARWGCGTLAKHDNQLHAAGYAITSRRHVLATHLSISSKSGSQARRG